MIFSAEDFVTESPKATALYAASASYCEANIWTSVNGWSAARLYTSIEQEYAAAHSAAIITDLGAITRYAIRGDDAAMMATRVATAPAKKLEPGESARGLILSDEGAVIDLAEVSRLSGDLLLLTTPRPHARRMRLAARGLDVSFDDITAQVSALGVFGPKAREAAAKAGIDLSGESVAASGHVRGVETAARTTEFGALPGVEMVFPREEALTVWERLMRFDGMTPAGLDTLEVLRIESGAPRPGADFVSAENARPGQARTPAELGLPHLAPLDRGWFNGRRALRQTAPAPSRTLVTLMLDTEEATAGVAVFAAGKGAGKAVGRITSCAFSPDAKRMIAFADIAINASGKPLEIAMAPPGEGRIAAKSLETAEGALAADFRALQKEATESAR